MLQHTKFSRVGWVFVIFYVTAVVEVFAALFAAT